MESSADPIRILVVDDEPRGTELLQRGLRHFGEIDPAQTGDDAWERFQAADYQLVISDQRMPGMSGVELLARVAQASPTCGRILVTGYTDFDSTIEAINAGQVHAYVAKPCDPRELRITVQGVLDHVLLSQENARLLDTLRVRNEELEQALGRLREAQDRLVRGEQLAAVGRMVSMLVHDLRGPVAALRANGTTLAREAATLPTEEIEEIAGEVVDEARGIERMCSMLDETTPDGRGRGDLAPSVLGDIARSAVGVVAPDATRQGVELRTDLDDETEIELDRIGVRRALLNLLYNALEAMPEGGLLQLETGSDDERSWIRVTDSGPGIPDAIRDRLFEPFVTEGKARGTGLGLAVVQQVVEDHAGQIEVAKPEGGGASFRLGFPRVRAADPRGERVPDPSEDGDP